LVNTTMALIQTGHTPEAAAQMTLRLRPQERHM
jgi:hypothetical protein